MTDAQMWALVVGALIPNVIAVVNQPRWNPALRTTVMVVICIVAGFITVSLNQDLTKESVVSSVLIIIVAAVTFYREVWSRYGVTQAIESATTSKRDKKLAYQTPYAETSAGPPPAPGV